MLTWPNRGRGSSAPAGTPGRGHWCTAGPRSRWPTPFHGLKRCGPSVERGQRQRVGAVTRDRRQRHEVRAKAVLHAPTLLRGGLNSLRRSRLATDPHVTWAAAAASPAPSPQAVPPAGLGDCGSRRGLAAVTRPRGDNRLVTSGLATLRLEPAVVTHASEDGNITRYPESHFLDLVVNNRSLRASVGEPAETS